ncbi:MAG TPA: hypothetical protein VGE66_14830 [Chitinophagaceae bacterium]
MKAGGKPGQSRVGRVETGVQEPSCPIPARFQVNACFTGTYEQALFRREGQAGSGMICALDTSGLQLYKMKTIRLAGLAALLFAAACNSGGNGEGVEDTSSSTIGPVENVNGNMPDTSNSITLGSDDTTGSARDTAPR